MTTYVIDNSLLSRGRRKANLVIIPGKGILLFTGETIPGVLRVLRETYTKNGKWSHTTWEVETTGEVRIVTHNQDFGTGQWLCSKTWDSAVKEFQDSLAGSDPAHIERFIRATWPNLAEQLDSADNMALAGEDVLAELFAAQEALAAVHKEVARKVSEETAKQEAQKIREDVSKAKDLLKKGASLADLKSLLA